MQRISNMRRKGIKYDISLIKLGFLGESFNKRSPKLSMIKKKAGLLNNSKKSS